MIAVIEPAKLTGTVEIPSSKSYAHRLLIASALSDKPTSVLYNATNADIEVTLRCLNALGASIEKIEAGAFVRPIVRREKSANLDCGESGSTLRFLLPVASALDCECHFTGEGRLPERPNSVLTDALRQHGVKVDHDLLPIHLRGQLQGGDFALAGNISSQYITGLLFALPLLKGDSTIALTAPLESSAYIDMTLDVLRTFGIEIQPEKNGWRVPGGQTYVSPDTAAVEGDWSSASYWLAAKSMGNTMTLTGLNDQSRQGDRAMTELLKRLGGEIDIRETPDLAPALAVAASVFPGVTHITGAARLRIKESDRLKAIADMINNLGGRCEEERDELRIAGVEALKGGEVDGCNDHRIVMAAAIAATRTKGSVTITDAQAVRKSYPRFFEEYARLGGRVYVE